MVFVQRVIKLSSMNVTITKSRLVFRLVIFARWLLFANFIKKYLRLINLNLLSFHLPNSCLVNYTINVHTLRILPFGFSQVTKGKGKSRGKNYVKRENNKFAFFRLLNGWENKIRIFFVHTKLILHFIEYIFYEMFLLMFTRKLIVTN